jgi:hypothetical protein
LASFHQVEPYTTNILLTKTKLNQTPRPQPESELYRQSDRRLSAKLVPTGAATSFKKLLNCTQEAEWTPFQSRYFSENLVAPGIERGPLDLYPGTLTTGPVKESTVKLSLQVAVETYSVLRR